MKRVFALLIITTMVMANLIIQNPQTALAACAGGFSAAKCSACQGISELGASQSCASNGSTVTSLIKKVVDILSLIVGVVVVIMIIIGGFKFVTSGGDANNVKEAKNTLLYALIGLVIVALAQVIVHTVLHTASQVSYNQSSAITKRV